MSVATALQPVDANERASAPAVAFRSVTKTYEEGGLRVEAVRGVTLAIPAGKFSMIVGPSGSGKTTLLNLIGCIDRATSGGVVVCGQDIGKLTDNQLTDFRSRQIGFVFQSFNLFPVLTAYENVEYPLLLLGVPARERRERTAAMLEAVGLSNNHAQRPNQLSGGQKQRVAIARALVKGPGLVLADEPTANLDSQTGAEVVAVMRKVQREVGASFVFSTHDPHLMAHADVTFAIRDGKLVEAVS